MRLACDRPALLAAVVAVYPTRDAALAALSAACVRYGRDLAGHAAPSAGATEPGTLSVVVVRRPAHPVRLPPARRSCPLSKNAAGGCLPRHPAGRATRQF